MEKKREVIKKIEQEEKQQVLEALESGVNFKVEAGAGSGKTHLLVELVKWLEVNKSEDFAKKHQHVVCITYTNAAVNEIRSRLSVGSIVEPRTIHKFVWENLKCYEKELKEAVNELEDIKVTFKKSGKIVYDSGIRYTDDKGNFHLNHTDVIKIFSIFFRKKRFRNILSRKYPVILIDEYQDTFKNIVDDFNEYIKEGEGPIFGFFGDAWQTIYSFSGACGLIESDNIRKFKKTINYRSQECIVEVLNRIRPEYKQLSAISENNGRVLVIITENFSDQDRNNDGDLNDNHRAECVRQVTNYLESLNGVSKVLMITHKLLAKQQGYENLLNFLSDKFHNQDEKHFVFFRDVVEPIFYCLKEKKGMFDVLDIKKVEIKKKKEKKDWLVFKEKLDKARKGNLFQVLEVIDQSKLIPIPDDIKKLMDEYQKKSNTQYLGKSLKSYYEIKYAEIDKAITFFNKQGLYSTEHGVKGEQYDNILFVIGTGWKHYQFHKEISLGKYAESSISFMRNRNLFYVCCSRAKVNLVLLLTVRLNEQFKEYLEYVFGKKNIVEYDKFLSCKQGVA